MKKIMLVLAFAGMGLFANADNGKSIFLNFTKKTNKIELKVAPYLGIWNVTITCGGSGAVYRFVGFNTQAEAQAYGWAFADVFC